MAVNYYQNNGKPTLDIHITLFQLLVSSFVISINEAKILLQIYIGPDKKIDFEQIFADQLKFPRQETSAQNRKNSLLKAKMANILRKLDEIDKVFETKDSIISGSNDIIRELIQQDSINKKKKKI